MDINTVIAGLVHGHGYNNHVLGKRTDGKPGEKEFSPESTKPGPKYDIKSPAEMGELLQDVLNHPKTKAISDAKGAPVHIYNSELNVCIVLNDSSDPKKWGGGTFYRAQNPDTYFKQIEHKKYSIEIVPGKYKLIEGTILSKNLNEVNAMVDRYVSNNLYRSTKDHWRKPDVQETAASLETRRQQKDYINVNSTVLTDKLEQDEQARRQAAQQAGQEAREKGEARIEFEAALKNTENEITHDRHGRVKIEALSPDGNTLTTYTLDGKNLSIQRGTEPPKTYDVGEKFLPGLAKKLGSGPSGVVLAAAAAALTAFASGASAAEVGQAAVDSVVPHTADAVNNGTSVAEGMTLDGAAWVAPATTEAIQNNPTVLGVVNGALTDVVDTIACAAGGTLGAAGGAVISSPTIAGAPVAATAGGVAGCMAGTAAVQSAREVLSQFIDYVSGNTDELPPRTPETDKLMAEIKARGAGYAPELAAIAEVWGSPKLTEQTLIGFREEGSHAELMQQIQAHLAIIASQPPPAQTGLEQSAAAWAPPALQM
jgi:hypothetical protein